MFDVYSIYNSQIKLAILVLLSMVAVIASTLAFEHLGGYIPCALCLKQREPYYIGIVIVFVALGISWFNGPKYLLRLALVAAGFLALWSLVLGAYHAGVEWSWWPGPSDCSVAGGEGETPASAKNLLDQLSFSKPPACNEAAGRFLGFSFAGWNVVVSAIIAIIAFRGAMISNSK